ncbi:hypothetical protein D3C81_2138160 [compost metagenome]
MGKGNICERARLLHGLIGFNPAGDARGKLLPEARVRQIGGILRVGQEGGFHQNAGD